VRVRDGIATDIDNRVNEMILEKFGREEITGDNYAVVSYQSPQTKSITYGIRNLVKNPIEATFDVNSCENIVQSTKTTTVKKIVKVGETEFIMHL